MPGFYIEYTDRDYFSIPVNTGNIAFTINNYSHAAIGGPKRASISAFGTEADIWNLVELLRCGIDIYRDGGEKVWWGIVSEVQVRVGALSVSVSIEEMANRISVGYSSFNNRKDTDWAEDEFSVDKFGYKEIRLTLSDATDDQADKLRDTALEMKRLPVSNISFDSAVEGSLSATIYGIGFFDTLDWRYYAQAKGLEQYDGGGGGGQKLGVYYQANTIAFNSDGTITDSSGSGLGIFDEGDIIAVRNSSTNDGSYTVKSANDTEVEIDTSVGSLSNEGAGATVTLESAHSVTQSFTQRSGSSWDASSIHLRVQKSGSPTDNFIARIYDGAAASSASMMASGSIAASSMSDSSDWIEIPLSSSATLLNNNVYWIVATRSGSQSGSDFYNVSISEDAGYAYGSFWVSDGMTFTEKSPAADMIFKVVGTQMTTSQIQETFQTKQQFFYGLEIQESSGVETNQFRDGENTALSEIVSLLETGTTSNRRMLAQVTPDRVLKVFQESQNLSGSQYYINIDRSIKDPDGVEIPLYKCPVGVWIKLSDIIPHGIDYLVNNISDFFLEEYEYSPQTDSFMPRSREARDAWDVAGLEQG